MTSGLGQSRDKEIKVMSIPTYDEETNFYKIDHKLEKILGPVGKPQSRCNYNPHTVECAKYAEHKIIETDTGKEFYCCSEHLKNYRDYNERANREVFVIVF